MRLILIVLITLASSVYANDTLRLGVLSYQPRIELEERYQPLVDDLNRLLQHSTIELSVVDYDEVKSGVQAHRFDLLIVDPKLYLWVRSRDSLSSVLATLYRSYKGQQTSRFGGVMLVRSDRSTQLTITNFSQYRIATPSKELWGTYWSQMYELFSRGIVLPDEDNVMTLNSPLEVVAALKEGSAEVGFLRTGQIEQLIQQGMLHSGELSVLNEQRLADYPFHTSTRLAPEWPVIALSHVEIDVIRELTSALLDLHPKSNSLKLVGIQGFIPAVDYLSVETALREMRVSPFDYEDPLTVMSVVRTYAKTIAFIVLVVITLMFGVVSFMRQRNELARAIAKETQARRLQEHQTERLDHLFNSSPSVVYALSPQNLQAHFVSSNCEHFFGETAEHILSTKDWWYHHVHEQDREHVISQMQKWREKGCVGPLQHSYRMYNHDGVIWVEDVLNAVRDDHDQIIEIVGAHTNVTARQEVKSKLELAASVFDNAREGIAITDVNGNILEVNGAFSRITGYQRSEIVGRNPRVLSSGRQSASFYKIMWRQILNLGFWEGEIWNRRKDGVIYAQNLTIAAVYDGQRKISHYISLFSDITRQKENEQQLAHIAYFDALTGLPNRANLTKRLDNDIAASLNGGHRFALGFLDLDGFKEINDTFGHDMGDLLLVEVAKRMTSVCHSGTTVSRFGGDEFVILVHQEEGDVGAERAFQQILDAIREPFQINGVALYVTASVGVTFFPQGKDIDADQLIRQADQAMYQAKIMGRSRLSIFNIDQESNLIEQHRLLEEIELGIERDQFCLYYQPKVNMRTGYVIGYEALIRWQHPTRGLLPPKDFLPYLYQQPLELTLGMWVLNTALKQLDLWHKQGYEQTISINIAGFQLQQPDFTEQVESALRQYPKEVAQGLELEILETSAIEDLSHVAGVINKCKQLGMKISLDDFGTGYSTLSHLKELDVDMLKIDHGFVRNMLVSDDDLAIVKGVIGFADAFHLKVIAEGVETQAHADLLISLGCELGQGYFISRPIPPADVKEWYKGYAVLAKN